MAINPSDHFGLMASTPRIFQIVFPTSRTNCILNTSVPKASFPWYPLQSKSGNGKIKEAKCWVHGSSNAINLSMSLTRNERVWKSWVIAALRVLPQHVADSSLIPSPTHPRTHTLESARSKIYILIVTFRVGLAVDRPGWNQTHFVNGRAISVERSPTVPICIPGALWQKNATWL